MKFASVIDEKESGFNFCRKPIAIVCQLFSKRLVHGVVEKMEKRGKYKHELASHFLFTGIDCLGFCLMLKLVVTHNLFLNSLREKAYLFESYHRK